MYAESAALYEGKQENRHVCRGQTYNRLFLKRVFENQVETLYLQGEIIYLSPVPTSSFMHCDSVWIRSGASWAPSRTVIQSWGAIVGSYMETHKTRRFFTYVLVTEQGDF